MLEFKSLYPPTVVSFSDGTRYAISGNKWVPVEDNIGVKDLKWTPLDKDKDFGIEKKKWEVVGSTGSIYAVKYQKGFGWHCSCKGYLYRRSCRHVDNLKLKYEKKYSTDENE